MTTRLKYLIDINRHSLPEDTDPDFEFEYLDIGAVGRGKLMVGPEPLTFDAAPSRARRLVKGGDTLVSTVRTYLRAVLPIAAGMDNVVVSTGFAVLSPRAGLDSGYLGWLAQSDVVVEEIVARSVGVSYPAINASEIGEVRVPVPQLAYQRAIADYLDAETARIDALIEKKRRMMALLEERLWIRFGSMLEAVDAKPTPLRRFLTSICDGPFGSSLTSGHYVEDGARVVRLGNIGFAEFKHDDKAYVSQEHYQTLLGHRVHAGDLLIAGLGDENNHVGRACVAPDLGDAIVKADCYCAKVNRTRAVPEFLALYLASQIGKQQVASLARGTTRSRINVEIARDIQIPYVPLAAQREIVRSLTVTRRRTRKAIECLQVQLDLLAEHRQALITAAVTGELEIPGAAA